MPSIFSTAKESWILEYVFFIPNTGYVREFEGKRGKGRVFSVEGVDITGRRSLVMEAYDDFADFCKTYFE